MSALMITSGAVFAVVAAIRSTWSPCGVSMLATITPLAERARRHRYRTTALWFVTGAVIGGACLGLLSALLAALVRSTDPGPGTLAAFACIASVLAAASDAKIARFQLPVHHRQVNERWLDGFRPWVYGAGFGWQIGCGLATYIKTATVYLVVVLAALTGSPWIAFGTGTLFGLVRGCAVVLGRNVTSPAALAKLHRRLSAWDPPSRAIVIALAVGATTVFALTLSPWLALVFVAASNVVFWWRTSRRRVQTASSV
jgi:hypothetical protein